MRPSAIAVGRDTAQSRALEEEPPAKKEQGSAIRAAVAQGQERSLFLLPTVAVGLFFCICWTNRGLRELFCIFGNYDIAVDGHELLEGEVSDCDDRNAVSEDVSEDEAGGARKLELDDLPTEHETYLRQLSTALNSFKDILLAEGLFLMALPFATFLLGALLPFDTPLWLQAGVMLTCVVRAARVDAAFVRGLKVTVADRAANVASLAWETQFLLSKLEIVDALSDGFAAAAVFKLERKPLMRERLQASWATTWFLRTFLEPLVVNCGFGLSGMMLVTLLFATAVQHRALSKNIVWVDGQCSRRTARVRKPLEQMSNMGVRANIAGLGAAQRRLTFTRRISLWLGVQASIGRICCEGAPQLYWQSNAISLEGGGLFHQPILAISILITVVMLMQKSCKMLFDSHEMTAASKCDSTFLVVCSLSCLTMCLVLYTCLHLAVAELCPGNMWNSATGCVDANWSGK